MAYSVPSGAVLQLAEVARRAELLSIAQERRSGKPANTYPDCR
jgi:hypothetical protein